MHNTGISTPSSSMLPSVVWVAGINLLWCPQMFNTPLNVTHRVAVPKPRPAPKEKPKPTAQSLNITYNRNDRTDIDTAGYRSYFFHFTQTGEVGDKEMEQIIISKPTMDEAIAMFEQCFLRGDRYKDSVITVERIGVDFNPNRAERVVMAY